MVSDTLIRPARSEDCARIATLFSIASDGVADYVWSTMTADYPGLSLHEIGAQRYARDNTAFSYQNCTIVERAGEVVGMVVSYPVEPIVPATEHDAPDPVLAPYAELEIQGSLYIPGLALFADMQGKGLGTRLLALTRDKARQLNLASLSLLVFEQNTGARRLYERVGFTEIDRRRIVPHPLIHASGDVVLMQAPV